MSGSVGKMVTACGESFFRLDYFHLPLQPS